MTGEGEDAALILLLRRVDRQWSPRVAALSALVSEFDLLRGSRDLVPRSTPSCRRIVRGQRMCGGRAGLGGAQGQVEQVRRRRAQGLGDRVEHGGRDSAFQLGVILDLTPARAATSPRRSRYPSDAHVEQPARCGVILARREIRNSRISGTVVHVDGHYGLNRG